MEAICVLITLHFQLASTQSLYVCHSQFRVLSLLLWVALNFLINRDDADPELVQSRVGSGKKHSHILDVLVLVVMSRGKSRRGGINITPEFCRILIRLICMQNLLWNTASVTAFAYGLAGLFTGGTVTVCSLSESLHTSPCLCFLKIQIAQFVRQPLTTRPLSAAATALCKLLQSSSSPRYVHVRERKNRLVVQTTAT